MKNIVKLIVISLFYFLVGCDIASTSNVSVTRGHEVDCPKDILKSKWVPLVNGKKSSDTYIKMAKKQGLHTISSYDAESKRKMEFHFRCECTEINGNYYFQIIFTPDSNEANELELEAGKTYYLPLLFNQISKDKVSLGWANEKDFPLSTVSNTTEQARAAIAKLPIKGYTENAIYVRD